MPPALVLTAGLGTRLRPLTLVRAKAAVPIAGVPLVRRIVARLVAAGVTDLVLNLHHLPHTIAGHLGDGTDMGARVRYSWEQPIVLGSAGGPRRALEIVGAEAFLIVNGDTLTDVTLSALISAHVESGAAVTLALVVNPEPLKYGGVRLDGSSRVTGFVSRGPAAAGSYHFIGVQMVQADTFRRIPVDYPVNSIGGLYDELLASNPGSIRGFVTDAGFWDVGTVSDYWSTSLALMDGGQQPGRNGRIHPSARLGRSIVWDDVEIGPHVTLDDCIVADRAVVPAGASYRRAALVQTDAGLTATPFD